MGGAWRATNASTAWAVADHEAWTSLPSARSQVLPWLAEDCGWRWRPAAGPTGWSESPAAANRRLP
jgi:hypothetical protein